MAEIEILGLYPDDPTSGKARAKAIQSGDTATIPQTWNSGGTTFTALKLNVTDTASAAASLLFDIQKGGVSQVKVDKNGRGGFLTYAAPDKGDLLFYRSDILSVRCGTTIIQAPAELRLKGGGSGAAGNDDYVSLNGDATDVLGIRRTTNAQTVRIYNTFTDASNYERLSIGWSGNVMTLATEAAGTGTQRNIALNGANRHAKISDVSSGTDAAYETAINAIIDALESHGLSATS